MYFVNRMDSLHNFDFYFFIVAGGWEISWRLRYTHDIKQSNLASLGLRSRTFFLYKTVWIHLVQLLLRKNGMMRKSTIQLKYYVFRLVPNPWKHIKANRSFIALSLRYSALKISNTVLLYYNKGQQNVSGKESRGTSNTFFGHSEQIMSISSAHFSYRDN